MRKICGIAVFVVCLVGSGTARAYELVRVLSGDALLVTENGRQLRLELADIWVPAPPGPGVRAEYMGEEARLFVEQALFTMPAFIKEVEPVAPGATSIAVRIRLGEHADIDLAELLARAGLGLVDRRSDADADHVEAVYRAEREARRALRGMHDGGYEAFSRRAGRVVTNFGIGTLASPDPRARSNDLRLFLDEQQASTSSSQSRGLQPSGIHRNAIEAIRDWGSRMGLPPDASNPGR